MDTLVKSVTLSWLSDTSEGHSYHEFATISVGVGGVSKIVYHDPEESQDIEHYVDIYKEGVRVQREFKIDGICF